LNEHQDTSSVAELLPGALEDLSHDIRLDENLLTAHVQRRRRARAVRRRIAGAVGSIAIALAIVGASVALSAEKKPTLKVATKTSVAPSTAARPSGPAAFSDLTVAPGCPAPLASIPSADGLAVEFRPTASTVGSDHVLRGVMEVSNTSSTSISVWTSWPAAVVASNGTIVGGGTAGPDPEQPQVAIGYGQVVPANGHVSLPFITKLTSCDGSGSGSSLAPGDYYVYVTLPADMHQSGIVVAPPLPITVS
jgi:hypothetical protein